MKKVLAIGVLPLLLTSCSLEDITSIFSKTYTIEYRMNLPYSDYVYKTVKIKKNTALNPEDAPEFDDYIFNQWTLDKEGKNSYLRWGLAVEENLVFYAQWYKYSKLGLDEQVDLFDQKLSSYAKGASKVKQELAAEIGYPGAGLGEYGVFYAHDAYEYTRYNDVTVKDYYQIDEDGNQDKYGEQQIYIKDDYVYDVYKSVDTPSDNEYKKAKLGKNDPYKYMGIDFQNLYGYISEALVYLYTSDDYDETTFMYEFTADPTKLKKDTTNYAYSVNYAYATYSENAQAYVTESYAFDFALVFQFGVLTSALVINEYYYVVGEEVQYYVIENTTYDFFYNDGNYPAYTGSLIEYQG